MLTDLSINRNDSPTYAQRAKGKILQHLSANAREELNKKYQSEVKVTDFTIISSHCAGGTIYHDMGIPFLTPTVNLAIDGDDFCTFCENLEYFFSLELKPYRTDIVDYPVGRLGGDVEIRFIHYNSFETAKQTWERRKERINFNKILIMSSDRDGMGKDKCLKRFDKLPYKKIMYTSKVYPYPWAVHCREFSDRQQVGIMTATADLSGRRVYEKYSNIPELINSLYE